MSTLQKRKRITVKLRCPNPLFEQWLEEWRDKAKENDSKMQFCFSTALSSLRKYPLPLESGKACKILKGFGDKLCQMLDNKLKEHIKHDDPDATKLNLLDVPVEVNQTRRKSAKAKNKPESNASTSGIQENYVPKLGSGGYAILVALYKNSLEPNAANLKKTELIKAAQPLSDSSFTKPEPGSFYTAWSSMRTLIAKHLVSKVGNPPVFFLTEEGILMAHKLYRNGQNSTSVGSSIVEDLESVPSSSVSGRNEVLKCHSFESSGRITCEKTVIEPQRNVQSIVDEFISQNFAGDDDGLIDLGSGESTTCRSEGKITKSNVAAEVPTRRKVLGDERTTKASSDDAIMAPNSFDVILLVDTQETLGGKCNPEDDLFLSELRKLNVTFEIRHLNVGDYIWIARDRCSNVEVTLPYIIERKRMDDLGHSIKDGRFHEQKFRLKQCGIQNVIYLVESYGKNDHHLGLPLQSLLQAATNTLIQDGFSVKFTNNVKHTVEYLSCMTNIIRENYKDKTLVSCPKDNLDNSNIFDDLVPLLTFREFNKTSTKNRNLRLKDLFVKQLLQIKGMSVDKAIAVTEKYPTPYLLWKAFGDCELDKDKMLANILHGKLKKKFGPVLSTTIYQYFTFERF